MQRVAITGISGYIGRRLLSRLSGTDTIEKIIGIDIKPPATNSTKLKFYQHSISEPLDNIFIENEVDSAIHLAFVLRPTRDRKGTQKVDVTGTSNFLKACHEAGVGYILYLSSHTVYGAHPDNPVPLKEDSPLRPLFDFQYSWDKVEVERLLGDFSGSHRDARVAILRSCPVVGPGAAGSVAAIMFKPPVMIGINGYDPPLQFVHEDDIIELVATFISQRREGVYNVAGDGEICYSEVAKLARKGMLKLPEGLLCSVIRFSWALRLQNESPPSGLEFIKYPPLVSTEKLKNETGFQFRYLSSEAIASFLSSVN